MQDETIINEFRNRIERLTQYENLRIFVMESDDLLSWIFERGNKYKKIENEIVKSKEALMWYTFQWEEKFGLQQIETEQTFLKLLQSIDYYSLPQSVRLYYKNFKKPHVRTEKELESLRDVIKTLYSLSKFKKQVVDFGLVTLDKNNNAIEFLPTKMVDVQKSVDTYSQYLQSILERKPLSIFIRLGEIYQIAKHFDDDYPIDFFSIFKSKEQLIRCFNQLSDFLFNRLVLGVYEDLLEPYFLPYAKNIEITFLNNDLLFNNDKIKFSPERSVTKERKNTYITGLILSETVNNTDNIISFSRLSNFRSGDFFTYINHLNIRFQKEFQKGSVNTLLMYIKSNQSIRGNPTFILQQISLEDLNQKTLKKAYDL